MSNYQYPRQKAPQRRFHNGRFENTHPYTLTNTISAAGNATRHDGSRELSQLAQRMTNIANSMTNTDSRQGPMPISVIGPGAPAQPNRMKPNQAWKGKCLKLIKNMLELEEAKPFREPLNGRKYPGYYLLVPKPIDLSEIVKKFRSGYYHAPHEFASDVRLMFDNLKKYFKNPDSPIFVQTQKVSWWFESEYQRILSTLPNKTPSLRPATPQASTVATTHVSDTVTTKSNPQLRASSSLLRGPNISICVSNDSNVAESSSPSQHPTQCSRVVVLGSPLIVTQPSSMITQSLPIATMSSSSTPQLTSTATTVTATTVTANNKNRCTRQTPLHQSNSSDSPRTPTHASLSRSQVDTECASGHSVTKQPQLEMRIEVSNIWFGRSRTRPQEALVLSENGFTMHLTKNGTVKAFHVRSDDIIKCLAHLGRNKKQTLFLFVLPNCMKRLEAFNPRFAHCSLIAIFATKLATAQISRLLHIFWVINKGSLFAPVFSEIDQKGALLLLSNIRPEIMLKTNERIQHMIFGATVATPDGKSPSGRVAHSDSSAAFGRRVSTSSVEDASSTSLPVTCTVTSSVTSDHQPGQVSTEPDEVSAEPGQVSVEPGQVSIEPGQVSPEPGQISAAISGQDSTTTTTNSASTSVVSSGSAPVCLRTLPHCNTRTVSIGLTQTVTSADTPGQQTGNDLVIKQAVRTRLAHSLPEDMQQIIRAKYSRLLLPTACCAPVAPPVSAVSNVSLVVLTSSGCTSVTTTAPRVSRDSDIHADPTSTGHQGQLPAPVEDDSDVDLEIIDELLTDSNDIITHTPTGITTGDDVMMTSESMSIRCPITQMIMKYPLKNQHCGHSYDFEGVQELIKQRANKAKCPVLGCSNALPLRMEDMLLDKERLRLIKNKSK